MKKIFACIILSVGLLGSVLVVSNREEPSQRGAFRFCVNVVTLATIVGTVGWSVKHDTVDAPGKFHLHQKFVRVSR